MPGARTKLGERGSTRCNKNEVEPLQSHTLKRKRALKWRKVAREHPRLGKQVVLYAKPGSRDSQERSIAQHEIDSARAVTGRRSDALEENRRNERPREEKRGGKSGKVLGLERLKDSRDDGEGHVSRGRTPLTNPGSLKKGRKRVQGTSEGKPAS